MLFPKALAPSTEKGFTLLEVSISLSIFVLIITCGLLISFNQYAQWLTLAQREDKLDTLIESRLPNLSTSSQVISTSFTTFSEPITVYENGELLY